MVYNNSRVVTLNNGLRVAMLPANNTRLVHLGLMIRAGSRDETKSDNGVAHLIEHTVFKGTSKRKSYHILNRIESVGGELNAYTSREKTCYLITCLSEYAGRAFDLLSDISFHATFPEKEIEKEKRVVLEEFEMFRDSPEDAIADDFMEKLFPGHSLGFDILGSRENLKTLGRSQILSFLAKHYAAGNMVLSISGNIPASRMEYYARKFFDVPLSRESLPERKAPEYAIPFNETLKRDFSQSHVMLGCPAPGRHQKDKYAMLLINNILGGTGMSSRLNMEVREKKGYAYNVWSNFTSFDDSGAFVVYLGTEEGYLTKSENLVLKELRKIREVPLTERQINTAKRQIQGHIAMARENFSVIMQTMAKNLLDYNELLSLDHFFSELESVTPEEVIHTAQKYLDESKISTLRYKQK